MTKLLRLDALAAPARHTGADRRPPAARARRAPAIEHPGVGRTASPCCGHPRMVARRLSTRVHLTEDAFSGAGGVWSVVADHLVPELRRHGLFKAHHRPGAPREKPSAAG